MDFCTSVGKWFCKLALLALLVVCAPAVVSATDYYVAPTGSGTACTSGAPCLTIAQGLATAAGSGNTLHVASGTYTESPLITTGGSSGSPFIVEGFGLGGSCPTTSTDTSILTPMPGGLHPAPTSLVSGHIEILASNVVLQCFELYPNPSEGINYQNNGFTPMQDSGVSVENSGTGTLDGGGNGTAVNNVTVSDMFIHGYNCTTSAVCTAQQYSDGSHAYFYGLYAGLAATSNSTVGANVQFLRIYLFHASSTCSSYNGDGSVGQLMQDWECWGWDDEIVANSPPNGSVDADYNEAGNTDNTGLHNYTQWIHGYMHAGDQAWVGAHGAHSDCFENSGGPALYMLIDRSICMNTNEGVYIWDGNCGNPAGTPGVSPADANGWNPGQITACPHGTYNFLSHIIVRNSFFAFGNGTGFGGNNSFRASLDLWHIGDVHWINNLTWGTGDNAVNNTDIVEYENNTLFENYQSGVANCQTPYGSDLSGQGFASGQNNSFDTNTKNLIYESGSCTVSQTGLYATDIVNQNPLFVASGSYTNVIGANIPNLKVSSGSPAILAGTNFFSIFSDDLTGNGTRSNAAFTIGPYTFLAVVVGLPPPGWLSNQLLNPLLRMGIIVPVLIHATARIISGGIAFMAFFSIILMNWNLLKNFWLKILGIIMKVYLKLAGKKKQPSLSAIEIGKLDIEVAERMKAEQQKAKERDLIKRLRS